ncbi:MAG: sulfotransferase domain-containing protein [Opitutales bacterium]|nr:sulfotransferase domain-containing protein [Opitutales bacterium]
MREHSLASLRPNLIGIGCAKCGTTSLAKLLSSHPEIDSPKKEMHFFDQGSVTKDGFDAYLRQYQPKQWRMDFTPSYIMDRQARFLIKDWLGEDLRFIVVLRNPVKRAYSHYCHAINNWIPGSKWVDQMGYPVENLSFREAIEQELTRMVFDPWHSRHLSYFSKGLYHSQLSRWFELFSPSRFSILVLEKFSANPQSGIRQLESDLGISLDGYELPKLNAQSDQGLSMEDYQWLWSRYEPEIEKLSQDFGIDVSYWKNSM